MDETISIDPVGTSANQIIKREPRIWHSCCLTADKDFCMYITQIALIFFVILFCIYQLLTLRECIYQTVYTSMLTLLIGLVIPSPAIRKIS
jgi:hypothetical protein